MRAAALARLGVALAFVALLVAPGSAGAKSSFDLTFQFETGDGHRITVGGYGATAFIKASSPGHFPQHPRRWSTYVARGKVTAETIQASFGDIGSAAMRFRPSGRVTHSKRHHGCSGGPDRYTIRFGVFVGSVHFRGEGGYASADVHRVKGRVVTPRLLACPDVFFGPAGPERGSKQDAAGKLTRLTAESRDGLAATYFAAVERNGKARFLALSEQSVGPLATLRGVLLRASPLTFAFDNTLGFASLTPPPPFSGTGSLQRERSGRKTWSGPLAVSFLGAPNVPLAGAGFKTQLTRSW